MGWDRRNYYRWPSSRVDERTETIIIIQHIQTLVINETDNQQLKTTSIRMFRTIDDTVTVTTSVNLTSTQFKDCKNGLDILKVAHAQSVKGAGSKN